MKHLLTVAAMLFAATLHAEDTDTLAPKLQEFSVTVHTESGQGSGTIITRDGVNFALTAGHVVEGNRTVTPTIDNGNGVVRQTVTFAPVTVVREIYNQDGQSVGTTTVEADVIAYSSPDYGHDLALLKLRTKITDASAEFYPKSLASVGTELVHVGSLLGQAGSNSFTTGSLSQVGRMLHDKVFDQSSCPAFPGSSGGGMFLKENGQYLGMLVRGGGETFNLFIPIRRMRIWATIHHIEFVFDPSKKVDLGAVVLEHNEPTTATELPSTGDHWVDYRNYV